MKILKGKIPTKKLYIISAKNSLKRRSDRIILKHIRSKRVKDFLLKYPTFRVMKFQCNNNKNQFVILHKSIKNGLYQLSYFDENGAIMDGQYYNYITSIKELIKLNKYKLVEVL